MQSASDSVIIALANSGADGAPPSEIQWMPPGEHEIRATKNGKPATLKVRVDKSAADAVTASFAALLDKGKRPYLDFNHAGGESAGRVTSVRWAGEDPKDGGIRATVEWSAKGSDAIKGGSYFSFSPTFTIGKDGKVTGTSANMGGLVNEPAFTQIAAVAASESNPATNMNKTIAALAAAGIPVTAEMNDDEAAVAVSAALAANKGTVQASETLKTENDTLKARVTELEGTVKASAVRRAEEVVAAAAAAGRIPPKDDATRKFWVDAIVTAGESAVSALQAMPVGVPKAPDRKSAKDGNEAGTIEAKQTAAIAEVRAANKGMTFDAAFQAAAAKNPELFQ